MRDITDIDGSSKRPVITRYTTSGAFTYIPTADLARCEVFVQASGAGAHASLSTSGGGAGEMIRHTMRVPIAGESGTVGAGGAPASNGADSRFGPITAQGGITGATNSGGGYGNDVGSSIPGGCGGNGFGAGAAGWPGTVSASSAKGTSGNFGGGDSAFGKGGIQAGAAATGYGSGEASGSGRTAPSGMVEVWDFGA